MSSICHVHPGVERCQMSVISRGWHGNTASAPGVHVTKLISELLKAVSGKAVIVVKHMIMSWSACPLTGKKSKGIFVYLQANDDIKRPAIK